MLQGQWQAPRFSGSYCYLVAVRRVPWLQSRGRGGLHDAIPSCRRDVSVLHTLYNYDVAFSRGSDDSG